MTHAAPPPSPSASTPQPAASPAEHPSVLAALDGGVFTAVEHHERVGSTNELARGRLAEGIAPGLVVVADRQTAGRGRRGRSWTDDVAGPTGPANLAVTAIAQAPTHAPELTSLAAGMAVADVFASQGAAVALKWPNDVLLDGRKAAGILVERHTLAGHDVVLIGCGLNLDWRGVDRDSESAGWGSLAEALGRGVDRGEVLGGLLAALTHHLGTLASDRARLLEAYRARCVTLGHQVEVSLPLGTSLRGTAVAIDDAGGLVVDDGRERTVVLAGDVVHVRPATPR